MKDMIWLGGVGGTLFLAVLSITAWRFWFFPYIAAVFLGLGTGVLLWSWPADMRAAWWLLWLVYIVALPIGKTIERRRRELDTL